jgi:hypothetical protein
VLKLRTIMPRDVDFKGEIPLLIGWPLREKLLSGWPGS